MAGAPAPAGFNSERLAVQATVLVSKRWDGVNRARPELLEALGSRFRALFDAYAAARPKPAHGGSDADAQAFVRHLAAQHLLPDPVGAPRQWAGLRRLVRRLTYR